MFGTSNKNEMELEKNKIGKWLEKYLLFSICEFLAQDPFSTPGLFDNFAQHEILYKMVSKHRNSKIRGPQPLWQVFGSYKKSVLNNINSSIDSRHRADNRWVRELHKGGHDD